MHALKLVLIVSATLFSLDALPVYGQNRLAITLSDVKTASTVGNAAIMLPIRCDQQGNIFYREMGATAAQVPPIRIAADAQRSEAFDISKAQADIPKGMRVVNFAISARGAVYQLTSDEHDNAGIIRFKQDDGAFDGFVGLDQSLEPTNFAVLDKGSFIVAGIRKISADDPVHMAPLLALFDQQGRFVRNIDVGGAMSSENVRASIYSGALESSGDFVYVLKPGSPSSVLLISEAGVLERKIDLHDPPGMRPVALRGGSGRFLVQFAESHPGQNDKVIFVLYDNFDGAKQMEYEPAPDLRGSFACYDWKTSFSFLALNDQMQRLILTGTVR